MTKIGVCLIASHPLVLAELQRLLVHSPFQVNPRKVGPGGVGLAVEAIVQDIPEATVYVIDSEATRPMTQALIGAIADRFPAAQFLLIGGDFDETTAFPLLAVGAKGLLAHTEMAKQLGRALQAVASGGYWVPRSLLSRFVDSILKKPGRPSVGAGRVELSRRETDVIGAVLRNLSNKEIANELKISERTVKFHVSNLLRKFGVCRRADLILLSYQETARSGYDAGPKANSSTDS